MPGRFILLALGLGLASCTLPANVIVLIPDEQGAVGKITVAKENSRQELADPYGAIDTGPTSGETRPFIAKEDVVRSAFARALAAKPRQPSVYTIFFTIGTTEVDPASLETLAAALTAGHTTPNADISVIGHSDAIGDDNENIALSLRRAQTVRDALVREGVSPSILEIGYHGSKNPLVPSPRGVPEPRNRRVEVTIR